MSFYFNNPHVWSPPQEKRLLAVLVPSNESLISLHRYLELLTRRVDWLIQRWMDDQEVTQEETQKRLVKTLSELDPNQSSPSLTDLPLETWRYEWGKTLVDYNLTVRTQLSFQAVSFPVQVEANPEEVTWLLSLFEEASGEIQPNLEEWLNELTYTPQETWI